MERLVQVDWLSEACETLAEDLRGASHDSDVAASGVRVDRERETTPAPASAGDDRAAFPSARPSSVPDYDVVSHAFETSLRHPPLPRLPLDVAVPVRTKLGPPVDLELRASFLLLHVDGRASVGELAELTSIPVDEVVATIVGLTAEVAELVHEALALGLDLVAQLLREELEELALAFRQRCRHLDVHPPRADRPFRCRCAGHAELSLAVERGQLDFRAQRGPCEGDRDGAHDVVRGAAEEGVRRDAELEVADGFVGPWPTAGAVHHARCPVLDAREGR